MSVFTVVSTVTHRSLMNKSKDDLARWVMHLLDCRDENEKFRVQRVVDLLEANNAYQQDARDARIALKGQRFGLTALQQELEALKEQSARQEQTITFLNERAEAAESELAPAESGEPFQQRVHPWMMACFGHEISADRLERGDRFIEEAIELLQSGGYPRERITALTDYVYAREPGDPAQEVGGVMVTLAAYCLAHDLDMHEAAESELARIWTKVEKIRAKQAAKPTGSALPVPASTVGETTDGWPDKAKFQWGDRVSKIKGSSWIGRVCGIYSTPLTPIGYAVESENEPGSVQIYPEAALERAET